MFLQLITNKSHATLLFLQHSMDFYSSYEEMSSLKRLQHGFRKATLSNDNRNRVIKGANYSNKVMQ